MRFGVPELLLLALIALWLFGPQRLPEVGRALGRSVREFRAGLHGGTQRGDSDSVSKPQP